MTSIPHTPTRVTQYAPPPTPRSSAAREIKARHSIQATTTVTISAFASLITELTASYTSPSTPDEWTRLDMIETFREDFLCGGFQRSRPEEILEDAFSDGTRVSLGTVSSVGSKTEHGTEWPASAMQRGSMAEQTIKQHLRSKRALFKHGNFKSIAGSAVRCMTRVSATGQPVYLACGLLKSPHWGTEYGEQGWAAPGIRWGNFKPDLIKFSPKYKGLPGEMEWEVVEIKYSGNTRRIVSLTLHQPCDNWLDLQIYASYKIQAIYCASHPRRASIGTDSLSRSSRLDKTTLLRPPPLPFPSSRHLDQPQPSFTSIPRDASRTPYQPRLRRTSPLWTPPYVAPCRDKQGVGSVSGDNKSDCCICE
jgi:hypothetical protein